MNLTNTNHYIIGSAVGSYLPIVIISTTRPVLCICIEIFSLNRGIDYILTSFNTKSHYYCIITHIEIY